jgi:hypothetical protein
MAGPSQAAARMHIGVAPQMLSLYEELSAIENLKNSGHRASRVPQLDHRPAPHQRLASRSAGHMQFGNLDQQTDRLSPAE